MEFGNCLLQTIKPFEISKGFMLSVRIQQHYVMKHPVLTAAIHVSVML